MLELSKAVQHEQIITEMERFRLNGKKITTLYPSHVNHTGKQPTSARTRENKFDRSMRDYQPDNL
jgi:hypothetical protein